MPLLLGDHGSEEIKWANVGGMCSMSPVQSSAEGCCDGCTINMAEPWERRAVQGFGPAKKLLCGIYVVLLQSQETAMTSLHETIENAGYAVVIPWVSCSDR